MPKNQDDLSGMDGPGVSAVRIKEVDDAAEDYLTERDKRMRQTPKEVEAKKKFVALLHKHEKQIGRDNEGVLRYPLEGLIFELKMTEEKLSVRKAVEDDGE
jgi:hypothetical protein